MGGKKDTLGYTTEYSGQTILNELLKDPTRSLEEIARSCNSYRQKVWREKKKLEDSSAIWGYTAVVDENVIEWKVFLLLMRLKPLTTDQARLLINRHLTNAPGKLNIRLMDTYYLNGKYDLLVIFAAPDWMTSRKYYDSIRLEYEEYLEERPEIIDVAFSMIRWGKVNPNLENLREFIPPAPSLLHKE
jgi:DNA-binding Lrp family transcriptional regulator